MQAAALPACEGRPEEGTDTQTRVSPACSRRGPPGRARNSLTASNEWSRVPQQTADFGETEMAESGRFWLGSVSSTVPEYPLSGGQSHPHSRHPSARFRLQFHDGPSQWNLERALYFLAVTQRKRSRLRAFHQASPALKRIPNCPLRRAYGDGGGWHPRATDNSGLW